MHVHNDVTPFLLATYPPPDFISLPPPPFYSNYFFPVSAVHICMVMESSIRTRETYQWPHPQRRKNFPPLSLPIARGSSGKHNARKSSPFSMWKIKMTWFCVELVQTATGAASVWVQSPFTALLSLLQSLQSFHLSFHTPRPTSELFGNSRNTNWIYVLRDFKWEAGI